MNLTKETIQHFANFVSNQLGIFYSETNFYQLESRILEVIKQLGLPNAEALKAELKVSVKARDLMLDAATNNETLFFRDPPMYAALEGAILGQAHLFTDRTTPLRIWSAACSLGQEVYSVAMTLEKLRPRLPASGYEILATDISDKALKHADNARYSDLQVQRGLDASLLSQYFRKTSDPENCWEVRPELKRNARFQKLNLLDSFQGIGKFDIVLCRNVLIYQPTESKKDIIKRIHALLQPNGYLILGSAESLIGLSDQFEMIRGERSTLYRKILVQQKVG